MTAVETSFFDSKCDAFVEGYRFVPSGESWTREDGVTFTGEMIAPWKPYAELDNAQREYERQLLAEYENALAEASATAAQEMHDTMLADMDAAYREGVASA